MSGSSSTTRMRRNELVRLEADAAGQLLPGASGCEFISLVLVPSLEALGPSTGHDCAPQFRGVNHCAGLGVNSAGSNTSPSICKSTISCGSRPKVCVPVLLA